MDDFRVGHWLVQPQLCRLSSDGRALHVRAKVMELLQYLAAHRLEVVSKDTLLDEVWSATTLSESALTRTMTELRQALGDDIVTPTFIETIPKRGYRFIAPVTPAATPLDVAATDEACSSSAMTTLDAERRDREDARAWPVPTRHTVSRPRARWPMLAVCGAALVAAGLWWTSGRPQHASGPLSLAVLPFKAMAAGDQYLADGMTDAITTELGRVAALRVTSANAAFRHRDATTVRNAADALGVGFVVLGTVQEVEGATHIDARLIDARTDAALWVQRYEPEGADVLTVQDDIARQVAATLARRFDVAVTIPAPAVGTTRPDAHRAYLRGLWYLRDRTTPDAVIAVRGGRRLLALRELQRAVALDPTFARAHATLASVHTQRLFYDAPDQAEEQRAFMEIQQALTLDSRLAKPIWPARSSPGISATTSRTRPPSPT